MSVTQNEEPKDNELPESERADGLTAGQAAEVRPYDEVEVWKKSKNTLFSILGIIASCVAISTIYTIIQTRRSNREKPAFL